MQPLSGVVPCTACAAQLPAARPRIIQAKRWQSQLTTARKPLLDVLAPSYARKGQRIVNVEVRRTSSGEEAQPASSAIVLGASIAGLLAAWTLSKKGWRVTIVEKDKLRKRQQNGNTVEAATKRLLNVRSGVPQARHIHCLLPEGARALDAFFPGFKNDLVAAGGRRIPFAKAFKFNVGGWWLAEPTQQAGYETVLCSRVLIEQTLCSRVLETAGVSLLDGHSVKGLLGNDAGVRGVLLTNGQQLHASLVVDASGRGSRAAKWVSKLGVQPPEREVIDCNITYADALMRPAAEDLASRDWHVLRVDHAPGQGKQSGIIYEIERDLWLVGLAGYHGQKPPKDRYSWLNYAKGLPDASVANYISRAEMVSPISRIAATANVRHRWENLKQPLAGFLAIGDQGY